jgi:hypothetical protein
MDATTRDLAVEYVLAVGDKHFDRLADFIHPDATFGGTVKVESRGRAAFVQGFRNLAPIIVRNDVRDVVADDERAFVLYDSVTDTPAGSVTCAELLTFDEGLIRSSTLIFDWRRWPEVLDELQSRTKAAATPHATKA